MTVIDHEQNAATTRRTAIVLGVILALGAALRFWSLGGGLPSSLGVDEPQIMIRALTMVRTGDFHPHFFDYPGLYLYLQAAVVVARFLAGASAGTWSALAQVTDYDFYLWGRALTAAFGTATVFLVYRAGTRWGVRQALVAAALCAVFPIHVRESHYVLTDVPMTFFVALALVLALRALEVRSWSSFAWAGAAAGLAAGTKYTAWVSILMPLVAAGFAREPFDRRLRFALTALAGFFGAFAAVAPYTLLDLPAFLDGFAALAAAVPKRAASADPGWQIYAKHLRMSLGWPATILAACGLGLFVERSVRAPRRAPYLMVVLFVAVFWSMIVDRTLIFARYLMPIVPFVCLLVGAAVAAAADGVARTKLPRGAATAALAVLLAGALAQPAISAVALDREMGRRRTDSLAMDWIKDHVKPGARIAHEVASLHFPPGRYQLEYVRSLTEKGLDFYLGGQADYVVASAAVYGRCFADPQRFQPEYLAYRDLFARLVPVFSAQPSPEHPGPEIRIFETRK
jgi:4-amino-4-deoxy-L-arabinose transferase-like glycosyltransferase